MILSVGNGEAAVDFYIEGARVNLERNVVHIIRIYSDCPVQQNPAIWNRGGAEWNSKTAKVNC